MSDQQPRQTKKERREEARAERLEQERLAQAADKRKKLMTLGGLVGAAVVVVIAAIVISTSGSGGDTDNAATGGEVRAANTAIFDGIPQKGNVLGKADAPATVVVFADAQCPFCRDFEQNELPDIISKYVKDGKAKVDMRLRAFINENSDAAGQAIYAAASQDKMFQTAAQIFSNQGPEGGTVWATRDYLKEMLAKVPGLDADKAFTESESGKPAEQLQSSETLAQRFGSTGTPDIYVGKSTDDAEQVGANAAEVGKAIDEVVG